MLTHEVHSVTEMSDLATELVAQEGYGVSGDTIVISAGLPFAESGTTNLLRIAQLP